MLVHRPFSCVLPVSVNNRRNDGFHSEFSPFYFAVLCGNYDLVWSMIEHFGVDVDHYCPPYNQMTILHVIARYKIKLFDEFEKENVRRLVLKAKRLDW